jgi:glutamate--cysteine ligase catalytic subunit
MLVPCPIKECSNVDLQQLLAIWRNAKGKERDALLWGDEVRSIPVSALNGD